MYVKYIILELSLGGLYTLRPFMLFQKNMEDLMVISGYHENTSNPPEMLIEDAMVFERFERIIS